MCIVDLPSGRLSQTENDFSIPGPIPLALERHYRSTNLWLGDLGYGWGHTLGMQLWCEAEQTIVFRGGDGRRVELPLPANAKTTVNDVERIALEQVPRNAFPWDELRSELTAGALVVHLADGCSLLFDARPRERQYVWRGLADRSGNLVLVEPDALGRPCRLLDPWGRILNLTRNADGMLVEVQLADAAEPSTRHWMVRFEYNASRDLVAAHDSVGTRTYAYDREHRLVLHTDRCGGACTTVYDHQGRCQRTSGPAGVNERTFEYDPKQQTTVVKNSLGKASQFVFMDAERVVRSVDEAGNVSLFEYDQQGRLQRAIDPLGNATVFGYDSCGRPVGKVDPSGAATVVEMDSMGEVRRVITPTGAVREYQRDRLGRVVSATQARRGKCQIVYAPDGGLAEVQTPFGKKIALQRSSDGKQVVESDDQGILTEQHLDLFGRLVLSRDALGAATRYEYDPAGRFIAITNPDQTVRKLSYDAEGRLTGIQDEAGTTVVYQYDLAGRRVGIVLPNGQVLRCQYDTEDRLIAIRSVDGLWHRYEYEDRGLVAQQHFIDGRAEQYIHDARGLLTQLLGPAGTWIRTERDPAGRITHLKYSDGSEKQVTMDEAGNWVRIVSNGHVLERELTEAGQATAECQDDFTLHREFGEAGELLALTDSFGCKMAFAYNEDGKITEAQVSSGRWQDDDWRPLAPPRAHSFEYDRVGNLLVWKMPAGKVEARRYDARRRMVEQKITRAGKVILTREYEYDAIGRVRVLKDSRTGRRDFKYGSLGELQSVWYDGAVLREFHYDSRGDLVQDNWQYDPGHRLRTTDRGEYEYDQRGFLVRRRGASGSDEFVYSDQGALQSVRNSKGQVVTYKYDGHARLIVRQSPATRTRFYWDGDYLWGYHHAGFPPRRFLRFPNSFTPLEQGDEQASYTVHSDQLGRVRELIDDSGRIVWEDPSDVWGVGRPLESSPRDVECLLGLPGQIWDPESGLYYNRYRQYVAEAARYTTPDPIGIWSGLDAYRYVSDPVNFQDPLGLKCRGKNDDPALYRSDSRPPSEICGKGFEVQNRAAGLTLAQHVEGVPAGGSNWISTTHDRATADGWMGGQGKTVYKIDNPGCGKEVDCDPDLMAKYGTDPSDSEHEIAFNKDVPPSSIAGWFSADPAGGFKFNAC